jgi:uncharacterized membrane protein YfcA
MEFTSGLFVLILFVALVCQYVSVSIGVGYGIILTPLLLILGFAPLQVVPAVLFSQFAGGTIGSVVHHRLGNIELEFKRDRRSANGGLRRLDYLPRSNDAKVIAILAACGVAGVLVGVLTAMNIPRIALETYIGAVVLGIGLLILIRRNRKSAFSWRGLTAVGLLGGFNKGISGGAYVVLAAGGQIIVGRETKNSLGSTTMAVTIVCAVGFLGYLLLEGDIHWMLVAAASIGSVIAAPFAALTVKKVAAAKLKLGIGLATTILGLITIVRTFIS